MSETWRSAAAAADYRPAKLLCVLAITASAVSAEYRAGINFVSTRSLQVYSASTGWCGWQCS